MATITVEDGTVVANATSYATVLQLTTYASERGITITGDADELLINAMDYIEAQNFIGTKYSKDQDLQWPRVGVVIDGYSYDRTEIPALLITAQIVTALAIDIGEGPLSTFTQNVKRKKVDSLEIEYMDGSSSNPFNKKVRSALSKLVVGGTGFAVPLIRA